MKNVCIVGLGSIGRRHIGVLKRLGVEHVVGVDLRQDRIAQANAETAVDVTSPDFTAVLNKENIDTVFVTLPTAYHTPVIKEAVNARCNLFIEKPVAATSDELDEILDQIRELGINSHVAYCYRYAPSVQRMHEIVRSGKLGKILSARLEISTYLPDWHPWEDYRDFYMSKIDQGGGARLDESHGIDLLRWMFGEVKSVSAMVGTVSELDITSDDLTIMHLKFKSGLVAEAHFDLLGRSPRIGLELIGANGTLLWDRISGKIEVFEPNSKEWSIEDFGTDDFVKSYDLQAKDVIERFRKNESSDCDFEDGLKTLKILEASLESSNSGRLINL